MICFSLPLVSAQFVMDLRTDDSIDHDGGEFIVPTWWDFNLSTAWLDTFTEQAHLSYNFAYNETFNDGNEAIEQPSGSGGLACNIDPGQKQLNVPPGADCLLNLNPDLGNRSYFVQLDYRSDTAGSGTRIEQFQLRGVDDGFAIPYFVVDNSVGTNPNNFTLLDFVALSQDSQVPFPNAAHFQQVRFVANSSGTHVLFGTAQRISSAPFGRLIGVNETRGFGFSSGSASISAYTIDNIYMSYENDYDPTLNVIRTVPQPDIMFNRVLGVWNVNGSVLVEASADNSTFTTLVNNTETILATTGDHLTIRVTMNEFVIWENNASFTVSNFDNVTPILVSINAPSPDNNSFVETLPIIYNVTATDNSMIGEVYVITNTTRTTLSLTSADTFTGTFDPMSLGTFEYQVTVNDTMGNIVQSGFFLYTVDNVSPVIAFTVPNDLNTSDLENTDTIDVTGTNIQLVNGSVNITQSGVEQITEIETNILSSTHTFNTALTGLGDGVYDLEVCFIDQVDLQTCQTVMFNITAPLPPTEAELVSDFQTTIASLVIGGFAIVIIIVMFLGLVGEAGAVRRGRTR